MPDSSRHPFPASQWLLAIIESSRDAIISKDLNGIIRSWNKGAELIFGYSAHEAIGQSVTMLMPPDRVNEEPGTRWSMNCRFKSIMSPYADKRFGEFFEPILLRPATRVGMQYKLPGGFHG